MRLSELKEAMEIYHKNFQLTGSSLQAKVAVQLKMKLSVEQAQNLSVLYELTQKLSRND